MNDNLELSTIDLMPPFTNFLQNAVVAPDVVYVIPHVLVQLTHPS